MVKQTSSFALCAVLIAALCSSCGGKKPPDQGADQPPSLAGTRALAPATSAGLVMRLGSGGPDDAPDGQGAERVAPAQARPLAEAQTQRLLARLPALPRDPGTDFALPPRSRPAPRPGQDIAQPFPPTRPPEGAAGPPAADATRPLAVLRYARNCQYSEREA